jgi:hypothetical protein
MLKLRLPERRPSMTRHPTENQFQVRSSEAAVEVLFWPTGSRYTFERFADPRDIAEFGPLSPGPHVRHGRRGDTGNYLAPEVQAMAFRLALKA